MPTNVMMYQVYDPCDRRVLEYFADFSTAAVYVANSTTMGRNLSLPPLEVREVVLPIMCVWRVPEPNDS